MTDSFYIFIGENELRPNSELSITEAAESYTIRSTINKKLLILIVNLTTDSVYEIRLFHPDDTGVYVPFGYDYRMYPIDPGTYVMYIFTEPSENIIGMNFTKCIFSKNFNVNTFGNLAYKVIFYVKTRSRMVAGFNLLPLDIQRYLIERNFSIYEIMDFILSHSCNPAGIIGREDPRFWQLLATSRLSQTYDAGKDRLILDLKRTENVWKYDPCPTADTLSYFADLDVFLAKLKRRWDQERMNYSIIYLLYELMNDSRLELEEINKIIRAWFPSVTVEGDSYSIIAQVIPLLTDYEFEVSYHGLLDDRYDARIFELFLENIEDEDQGKNRERYYGEKMKP